MLKIVFLVLAVICFVLKAFSVSLGRVDPWYLGWAFVISSMLV